MQEGLDERISYDWIEIIPLLAVLILVVVGLAIIPNCLDNSNCTQLQAVKVDFDLDKLSEELNRTDILFSMTILEKP